MSKEAIVVSLCSLGIICGFIASLYLMTTINPEPLPNTKSSEVEEPLLESLQAASKVLDAHYGLDLRDFYETKRPGMYSNNGIKVVPPLWRRRKNKNIMPPIWPTTPISTNIDLTQSVKPDQYDASTTEKILTSSQSNVKSRKSRSDYISHEDLGSIILKILNISSIGKPRIEIKLHPKGCLKKKTKESKHAKNKRKLTAKQGNNNFVENKPQIENRTVINVCGNDSVVIDEDLDILELIELVKSISSVQNNILNATNENMTILPYNKNVSDNMLFESQIELINILTENDHNINFNICNVSDIHNTSATEPIKGATEPIKGEKDNFVATHLDNTNNTKKIDAVKNSSEIDAIVTTQISNKDFTKMVLHEEEIDSITIMNSHVPDQVTMINDIIQSNITDLYIENDSDIIY